MPPRASRSLTFPPVTGPLAPPLRPERHIPDSIATLRRRLIVALARRDGAPLHLAAVRCAFPWLRHVFADAADAGGKLRRALAKLGTWTFEIVRRSDAAKGFGPMPRRWVVEQSPLRQGLRGHRRERPGLALYRYRKRQAARASDRQGVTPDIEL